MSWIAIFLNNEITLTIAQLKLVFELVSFQKKLRRLSLRRISLRSLLRMSQRKSRPGRRRQVRLELDQQDHPRPESFKVSGVSRNLLPASEVLQSFSESDSNFERTVESKF